MLEGYLLVEEVEELAADTQTHFVLVPVEHFAVQVGKLDVV